MFRYQRYFIAYIIKRVVFKLDVFPGIVIRLKELTPNNKRYYYFFLRKVPNVKN